MWAPAQILGSLLGGGFSASASANERTAPNAIFADAHSADSRDEWRTMRHDNGVSVVANFRDKSCIEWMDAIFSLQAHLASF
jgi:hypothetical protein